MPQDDARSVTPDIKKDAGDLAAALGIPAATFTGEEGRAYVAMGLIAKFPQLSQGEREAVLRRIDQEFHDSSPAFPLACSSAASIFVANPDWSITEATGQGLLIRLKVDNVLVSLLDLALGLGKNKTVFDVVRGKTVTAVRGGALLAAFQVVASVLRTDRDDADREARRRERIKAGVTAQDLVIADLYRTDIGGLGKLLKYSPVSLFGGGG